MSNVKCMGPISRRKKKKNQNFNEEKKKPYQYFKTSVVKFEFLLFKV